MNAWSVKKKDAMMIARVCPKIPNNSPNLQSCKMLFEMLDVVKSIARIVLVSRTPIPLK